MKKLIFIGIIILLVGLSFPSTGINVEKSTASFDGKTLYVGGSGPGNYTKIQDAIDNASDGDIVYVFNGFYNESINIDKSIDFIGENKNTTIINGKNNFNVTNTVNISADGVVINGFTFRKLENNSNKATSLIFIQSDNNTISGNIISGNTLYGIYIFFSNHNIISGNIINNNACSDTRLANGIAVETGKNNNISRNIIKSCQIGIELKSYSNNNSIFRNVITNNSWGMLTGWYSIYDIISHNNISYNFYGIVAWNCLNYKIIKNNFINNRINALFTYSFLGLFLFGINYKTLRNIHSTIKWYGNYWNKSINHPKPIIGWLGAFSIPWIQFDWRPAKEPYDI